jgi:hypothetical protein
LLDGGLEQLVNQNRGHGNFRYLGAAPRRRQTCRLAAKLHRPYMKDRPIADEDSAPGWTKRTVPAGRRAANKFQGTCSCQVPRSPAGIAATRMVPCGALIIGNELNRVESIARIAQ